MACQGGTVKFVKPHQIIHPSAFVRGYNEVRKGIPMDYDAYFDNPKDRESYERGRMFGCVFNGSLKYGKKATYEAQRALSDAFYSGAVI